MSQTQVERMTHPTIDDYGTEALLEVANAAKAESWRMRKHPDRDGYTIYSRHGYVIHPDLGFVNDDEDAAFIGTFDPAMVVSILERLARLESLQQQSQPA